MWWDKPHDLISIALLKNVPWLPVTEFVHLKNKDKTGSWRDFSAVNIPSCFCTGSEFSSQHLHTFEPRPSVIPIPGELMPSPGLLGYCMHTTDTCLYADKTLIHKIKQLRKKF